MNSLHRDLHKRLFTIDKELCKTLKLSKKRNMKATGSPALSNTTVSQSPAIKIEVKWAKVLRRPRNSWQIAQKGQVRKARVVLKCQIKNTSQKRIFLSVKLVLWTGHLGNNPNPRRKYPTTALFTPCLRVRKPGADTVLRNSTTEDKLRPGRLLLSPIRWEANYYKTSGCWWLRRTIWERFWKNCLFKWVLFMISVGSKLYNKKCASAKWASPITPQTAIWSN